MMMRIYKKIFYGLYRCSKQTGTLELKGLWSWRDEIFLNLAVIGILSAIGSLLCLKAYNGEYSVHAGKKNSLPGNMCVYVSI